MRTFPSMAAPKINILCGYLQNCSFIRRVPPYYQFFWANFDDFQKMAYMLLVIFIYQIIHDSGWLTCLRLLWNPPMVHCNFLCFALSEPHGPLLQIHFHNPTNLFVDKIKHNLMDEATFQKFTIKDMCWIQHFSLLWIKMDEDFWLGFDNG